MTVDILGQNKVLVILCEKDMQDFSLDFDKLSLDDIRCRRILLRIMQVACNKSGIEMKGRNVSIEALAIDAGCYLLVTVKDRRRRTYKIKKDYDCICYRLGNSGNFLDTIEKLYRENVYCNKNSVYEYNSEYYLIFEYPSVPNKIRRILSEYGEKYGGNIKTSKIKENGRLVCQHNAIAQIGRYL